MKNLKNLFLLLILVASVAACKKKTTSGYAYTIHKAGSGAKANIGDAASYDVLLRKDDSLMFSTLTEGQPARSMVEDPKTETVRVEKSWKEAVSGARLTLSNLHATNSAAGDRLLIPVSRSRDGWRVTLSKLPNEPPLVYPATPESEGQLRKLLKAER